MIRVFLSELVTFSDGFVELPNLGLGGLAINNAGSVAMTLLKTNFMRGLFLAQAPGMRLKQIVLEGDQAPDGSNFTNDFGGVSINGANSIAFCGTTGLGSAIFLWTPGIGLAKLIGISKEVPNHPGTLFRTFRNVHLADDGTIIFHADYMLNGLTFRGLYEQSGAQLTVIYDQFDGIIVKGQRLSLIDREQIGGVLLFELAPRFANVSGGRSRVAFLQFFPAASFPLSAGLFIAVEK